jgi:tRNA (guanine-N7-)-methyltransferase
LLETLLPTLEVNTQVGNAGENPVQLDLNQVFPDHRPKLWLEIGFGGGEHLLSQAQAHPDVGIIGCEPFLNGVAKLLAGIDRCRQAGSSLSNIRIFRGDGRQLLEILPTQSLDRAFLLFPDPWPKTRHHKRRFIQTDSVDQFVRLLKNGSELRIATDHPDYCRWALLHMVSHPAFEWLAEGPEDWRQRPTDWPETRYEAKAAAAGRQRYYLRFRRLPR